MFEITSPGEEVNGCKAQIVKHMRIASDETDPQDNVQEIFKHCRHLRFDLPTLPRTWGTGAPPV
jgi:hypothetical protein